MSAPEGVQDGTQALKPGECINALRAMIAFSERVKTGGEPVTYQGRPIEGYTLMFKAGPKIGFIRHGMGTDEIVQAVSYFLRDRREVLPPDVFRELVIPLTAVLALEIATWLAEQKKGEAP